MDLVLLVLVSLIVLVLVHHVHLHYLGKSGKSINRLPGPLTLPLLGNLLALHVPLVELYARIRVWNRIYYPAYRLWFASRPTINIRHPDDFEILLTNPKQLYKDFAYELFQPWLKTGLLTSVGEKWQKRRKILTPAFHFNILKKYMDITNEQGEKAVTSTRAKGREVEISLLPFCSEYTLNIVCESAMGVSLDGESELAVKYRDGISRMNNMLFYRMCRPYIKDWMLPLLPSLNRENNDILSSLHGFTDKIVKERREHHERTDYKDLEELLGDDDDHNVYTGKRKRLAMLDLLLAAERDGAIDDEGIKEEVDTFVFEGHDTTSIAMCYTIMLLAENKEAQDRARAEVEEVMKRKNGVLQMADLQELNYLDRCIKESLRLFPPVPTIARHMIEDLKLKHVHAPKNSDVILHIVDLHRDPNFWSEPDKFDPDRFLPENSRERHPYAYVPFSAGSRNCIGQKFAMMELKSLLSRILHSFQLEPSERTGDVKILVDAVLRPSHPVHAKFVRIDR